jgi:hypothetical protein
VFRDREYFLDGYLSRKEKSVLRQNKPLFLLLYWYKETKEIAKCTLKARKEENLKNVIGQGNKWSPLKGVKIV